MGADLRSALGERRTGEFLEILYAKHAFGGIFVR